MVSSLTKSSPGDAELTPSAVALGITGVAGSVTTAECLFRVLYDAWLMHTTVPGYHLIYTTPVIMAVLATLSFAYCFGWGRKGWLLALLSLTLTVFVVSHFRGSHRWEGFYDFADRSRGPFMAGLGVAVVGGFVASRLVSKTDLAKPMFGLGIIAIGWTWFDYWRGLNIVTYVPYTRHLALSALATLSMLIVAIRSRLFGETI